MSTGDRAWRLKVGLDHRGVIPRQSLHMVIPRDEDPTILYALLAVLASSVASAWIGTISPRLYMSPKPLASMPIPVLADWGPALASLAIDLEAQQQRGDNAARSAPIP
jgi:hypothetical protein